MIATPPLPLVVARTLLRLAIVNALMLAGLLWAAHRLDWPEAWSCMGLLFAGLAASVVYLARANPELIRARRRFGPGTKRWDFAIFAMVVLAVTAMLHLAGFAHRSGWTRFPPGLELIGGALILLGIAGITWAQRENRHFESSVRVQHDRGHVVVSTGPYGIVRHPGYSAGILMVLGMTLALGEPLALIPAALVAATIAVRTVLEEKTLREGLPGYAEYMRLVRYRWIPGLW